MASASWADAEEGGTRPTITLMRQLAAALIPTRT
jgi:hypothetical protein